LAILSRAGRGLRSVEIQTIGAQFNIPLPIGNSRRGEVLQSAAEHAQAMLLFRQTELNAGHRMSPPPLPVLK
jgi:outer membrane protein TolC